MSGVRTNIYISTAVECQANWLANNTEPTQCLKRSNEINNETQIWFCLYPHSKFVVLLVTTHVDIILPMYPAFMLIANNNLKFLLQIEFRREGQGFTRYC